MPRIKNRPTTLGQLRDSGYQVLSIKEELRQNLIARMQKKEQRFPGIIGYENSVSPQLESAILEGLHLNRRLNQDNVNGDNIRYYV